MRIKTIVNIFLFGFLVFFFGCAFGSLEKIKADYRLCVARYEDLLSRGGLGLKGKINLAEFYYQFKDYEKVVQAFKQEIDTSVRRLLAKSYARLKQYTKALEVFDQLGEDGDSEYLYLYGLSAQEKNLFPKAAKIYARVKGKYRLQAKGMLESLGIKIEQGFPAEIKKLISQNHEFISSIQEEEAVTILADETIEINDDNTSSSRVHMVQQVLKEKGKEIGEVQISYDSTYERVELEYARTITPDGNVIYVGAENIRDVSKYLNYPLYSNAKAFIVSMPSVEVGSIIEYKAKIYSSKLVNEDDFNFIYRLRDYFPIAREKFELIVPEESTVNFKFINKDYAREHSLEPKKEKRNGKLVYGWDFSRVSPIIPEEKMPPLPEINPAVHISSFQSWRQIYDWWHGLFKDKAVLTQKMEDFLHDLTKGCGSDLEKIKKIHEFCAQNIRYVGAEYGESGYEPHPARDVFWNRYGDCKDQATLLVAFLRGAGFKAYPVLIPTRSSYNASEDFPSINFNHAIACVRWEDEFVFMDPTSSTTAFFDLPLGDQDRTVVVFTEDGYKILNTPLLSHNEVIYDMEVDIDLQETAEIERKIIATGSFASGQRYFLKYTHPQKIKETLQDKMKTISPLTRLKEYKFSGTDSLDQEPVLEYSFEARKFLNPANDLRLIPFLSDIGLDVSYVAKEQRNFPIEFAGLFKQTSRVKIKLAPNLKVKYWPKDQHLRNEWFEFNSRYRRQEDSLDFSQEFVIKDRFVPQKDYLKFKADLEEVFYLLREEVILEKE